MNLDVERIPQKAWNERKVPNHLRVRAKKTKTLDVAHHPNLGFALVSTSGEILWSEASDRQETRRATETIRALLRRFGSHTKHQSLKGYLKEAETHMLHEFPDGQASVLLDHKRRLIFNDQGLSIESFYRTYDIRSLLESSKDIHIQAIAKLGDLMKQLQY